ncbi:MAG TPA: hypothetical protein VGG32_03350, partial [Thermoplasmata archaeon]
IVRYVVTFKETGLPSGTNWSVMVGTATLWSTLTYINFHLANGSYSYTVANVANYSRSPTSGTFKVTGVGFTIWEKFSIVRYVVTFKETGLPSGTNWSVTVGATTCTTTGTTISFALADETYSYTVSAPGSGYSASPGTVTVNGATIRVTVTSTT